MISKGVTIGLLGFLIVALVGGSAYVLLRPNEASASQTGVGYTQNNNSRGQQAQGQGNGSQRDRLNQGQPGQGAGGQNVGNGNGDGSGSRQGNPEVGESPSDPAADHPSADWISWTGTVMRLEGDTLTLETADGPLAAHLGPEWYWETVKVTLEPGDEIQVVGFYEAEMLEVAQLENLTTGETATLRDDTGRPLWAGRGRGSR